MARKIRKSKTTPLSEGVCKICLESESLNALISPCKCSGSVSYVHEVCLKTWILERNQEEAKCEICQTPFLMSWEDKYQCVIQKLVFQNTGKCLLVPILVLVEICLLVLATVLLQNLQKVDSSEKEIFSVILLIFIGLLFFIILFIVAVSIRYFYFVKVFRNWSIHDFQRLEYEETDFDFKVQRPAPDPPIPLNIVRYDLSVIQEESLEIARGRTI